MSEERRLTPGRREALEALAKVGRVFAGSLDPEAVGEQVAHTVRELLRATAATIYALRPETGELVALALSGEAATTFDRSLTFPRGGGVAGLAVRERQPVVTADILADPRIELGAEVRARVARMEAKAVLALPLIVQDRVIGALSVGDRLGRVFETDQVQLAQLLADQAAVALEHARLYQEARDARDFLQSIAENSADAIVTTDIHGRFTYFSRGAEEIFGYRAEEIIGRRVAEFGRGGLEEARGIMKRLEAEERIRNYESGFRAKDGRWVDVSSSISLLRDASGAVVGTIGMMKDISERMELEAQLRQAQKMEAVGRLAGGIAHDFNNLLTVILGRSALLLDHLPADDRVRRDVELIEVTADRAAALVQQLLAFSRRQVLQPVVLDLNATVDGVGKMLQRLIGEHIELVTVRGAALGRVKADPARLEQVIVNLVVNARDAMPDGGRLTIETSNAELDEAFAHRHVGARPGRYVMLAVSDTGVGMDAETLAHIFEPFFTTKEPGRGTGLGLATVYGIVEQSGGYVWAESAPGRGTTLRIYLPQTEETARAEPTPMSVAPLRGSETVLVVEDDHAIRSLARDVLQTHGYGVLEARHGADAVWICDSYDEPIHLVITDVVMPHMSGRELVERLAVIRPDMRVLYMTGYTEDAIGQRQGLEPGAALLHKPFPPAALVRKVREVLDAPRPAS